MPEDSGEISLIQKVSLGIAVLALFMAIITASEMASASQKCELKPKGPSKWISKSAKR
jgi:hypothetical protein